MARRKKQSDSKDYGLELGLIFSRYFLDSDYLHYGLWQEGMAPTLHNLGEAQQRYTDALIRAIPAGVERILDVGCGSGAIAEALLGHGYRVDCVSPSEPLTREARAKLGERSRVFHDRFEALDVDSRYDLILFSESFQYIPIRYSLKQAARLLDEAGYVLICDVFKRDGVPRGPLGGAYRYHRLTDAYRSEAMELIRDEDITAETAPTYDVFDDFAQRFLKPTATVAARAGRRRLPWISRIVGRLFAKRLADLERKYLSGERNGATFMKYRTYRRILLHYDSRRAGGDA